MSCVCVFAFAHRIFIHTKADGVSGLRSLTVIGLCNQHKQKPQKRISLLLLHYILLNETGHTPLESVCPWLEIGHRMVPCMQN